MVTLTGECVRILCHGRQHSRPQGLAGSRCAGRGNRPLCPPGRASRNQGCDRPAHAHSSGRGEYHCRRLWPLHRSRTTTALSLRQTRAPARRNPTRHRPASRHHLGTGPQRPLQSSPKRQPPTRRISRVFGTPAYSGACRERKTVSRALCPSNAAAYPRLLPWPLTNRSTRSTVRSRASDVGLVPTTRMAVLDRCDEEANARIFATSRRS